MPLAQRASSRKITIIVTLAAVAVLVAVGIIVVVSYSSMRDFQDKFEDISRNEHKIFENLFVMQYSARERSLLLHQIITETDPFSRDEKVQAFYAAGAKFGAARRNILALDIKPEEQQILAAQAEQTAKIIPIQQRIIDLSYNDELEQAARLLTVQAKPMQDRVLALLGQLMQMELHEADIKTTQSREKYQSSTTLLITTSLIVSLIVILITLFVVFLAKTLFDRIIKDSENLKKSSQLLSFQKQAMDEHNIVSITDVNGIITYANDKFCEISQYPHHELIGQNHRLVKSTRHPPEFYTDMWEQISSGKIWHGEIYNRRKDGSEYCVATTIVPLLDDNGLPIQYISMRTDITELKQIQQELLERKASLEEAVQARTLELQQTNSQLHMEIESRKQLEMELKKLATTDALTGIYNRRSFNEFIEAEIRRTARYQYPLSVLFFDLDHFKTINDEYGHQIGDQILQQLSKLIQSNIREADLFARWGGEEFIIMATHCDMNCTLQFAEKLRLRVEQHKFVQNISVTCSFGVAYYQSGDNMESIIKRADDSLYKAKSRGRNCVETDTLALLQI